MYIHKVGVVVLETILYIFLCDNNIVLFGAKLKCKIYNLWFKEMVKGVKFTGCANAYHYTIRLIDVIMRSWLY